MAARVKKPGKYPDWLFDPARCFVAESRAGVKYCIWLCSGCGAPYHYRQEIGRHGGPSDRALKNVSGFSVGPCWRSKVYGVKCVSAKGWTYLYHQGMEPAQQPDQDPELLDLLAKPVRERRKLLNQ